MVDHSLSLSADPKASLKTIQEKSHERPVLVFKKSLRCEISLEAERQFRAWLKSDEKASNVLIAEIDVIAERSLARGLTQELGIQHESPQALLFWKGELCWHASHGDLNQEEFAARLRAIR